MKYSFQLAEPVIAALDPYQYAMYRLYRDHTKLEKGTFVKDLSKLNRDPSKVIILDVNPECYKNQPENGLPLKKWFGEVGDTELFRFESFFEGNNFINYFIIFEQNCIC